jgi:hypothetical protein
VNDRPKTNSFHGMRSFGVVVFVIDNVVASNSRSFVVEAAVAFML